jgi:FHA domain
MLVNDRIFVELQPIEGREHVLEPGQTIGREGCDVMLPDPDVSRRHAMVHSVDDGLGIEDLGSTNGTFVNGERATGITGLRPGDKLRFGNTVWRYEERAAATRIASVQEETVLQTAAEPVVEALPEPEPEATVPEPEPAAPATRQTDGQPEKTGAPATSVARKRGDVPAPAPEPVPSAIRPIIPQAGTPAPFQAATGGTRRGSAARRVEATVIAYAIVLATAAAVIVYLAQR